LVEIDEVAARLLRQYWVLLVFCIVVPLVAISLVIAKQPTMYAADARIITGSQVPASSAEAGAVVSQVQAIATGRTPATHALQAAGVNRNLTEFIASHVSVAGLGSSQVVDLTVTDRSPQVAQKVAKSLATEIIDSLNNVGQSGLREALMANDQEIVRLTQQRYALATKASASPQNQQLQAQLAGIDEVLANFTGDRGRLLIQASGQGLATVIDQPALPVKPESKASAQKLGLAGLLGLVAGILIASIAEIMRPTVPGARRVSRRLGAPTLGSLRSQDLTGERTPALENLALRLRLAATHAGVSTIALVDIDGERELSDLAKSLERALRDSPGGRAAQAAQGVQAAQAGLGGGPADNHRGHANAEHLAPRAGANVLVKNRPPGTENPPLRVRTLEQMKRSSRTSHIGTMVLCGPVARVSRITALEDLTTSSGWPTIGVVGVPRMRRRWLAWRDRPAADATEPVNSVANGTDGRRGPEGHYQ
jgi:capsular polysaccharide biosynthesis protein